MHPDLEQRLNQLASSQHGLLARGQALRVGATSSQIDRILARGRWMSDGHGIYRLAASPRTRLQTVLSAVLSVGPEAAASHQTAAELWGLLDGVPGPIHVTTTRPRWRSRAFVVHRSTDLASVHTTSAQGIPLTTVARTIVDLGAAAPPWSVEAALDAALRRQRVQLEEVFALIDDLGRQGRRGVKVARELVAARLEWSSTTESELEDEFQRLLQRGSLPQPESQFVVAEAGGPSGIRVDFAYPSLRLAIELDGYRYHTDPAAFVRDRERQNRLMACGYRVLRYTVRDLRDRPEAVIAEIENLLRVPVNTAPGKRWHD